MPPGNINATLRVVDRTRQDVGCMVLNFDLGAPQSEGKEKAVNGEGSTRMH